MFHSKKRRRTENQNQIVNGPGGQGQGGGGIRPNSATRKNKDSTGNVGSNGNALNLGSMPGGPGSINNNMGTVGAGNSNEVNKEFNPVDDDENDSSLISSKILNQSGVGEQNTSELNVSNGNAAALN